MGFFSRLFKIGEAEAHSLVEKLEDPIKMTEQGIRDLRVDLDKSLMALAEVKALAIRAKRDIATQQERAATYEKKATQLLQGAAAGNIETAEADRLATECLTEKQKAESDVLMYQKQLVGFENSVAQLDVNIKKLKSKVNHYENELKTLKARSRVADATKKINKQMSGIDSNGTVSMLERMKEKVDRDESLAEAYGEIASESKSIDEEINTVLDSSSLDAQAALAALKSKIQAK